MEKVIVIAKGTKVRENNKREKSVEDRIHPKVILRTNEKGQHLLLAKRELLSKESLKNKKPKNNKRKLCR